ncbi:helix-turn-helix transcriptional regulator [Mycoplasmopsis felifaucium]|uniref:Helix-turn-helix transcriptional regulator n=1 Tax=Mycoplasmopsis felifaucium TaxID=35768 RepID=A0ABZ2RS68_9BACT
MNNYNELIPELRAAMNINQEDFASLLGVATVTVSRWENGHSKPKKIVQIKLKKLFDRYDIKMEVN